MDMTVIFGLWIVIFLRLAQAHPDENLTVVSRHYDDLCWFGVNEKIIFGGKTLIRFLTD